MSGNTARHINALSKERLRLVRHLEADGTWLELAALDAGRAGRGAENGEAAQTRAKLENVLVSNPLYRALIKVDEAIAALAGAPHPEPESPDPRPLPRPSLIERLSTVSSVDANEPLEAVIDGGPDWLEFTAPVVELAAQAAKDMETELSTEDEPGAHGAESHPPPVSLMGVDEAEVTIVARGTPVLTLEDETDGAHETAPAGSLYDRLQHAQDFDAAHYAAYQGTVEEAHVEIVKRDKDHGDPNAPS